MLELIKAIILGVVQGLTEFLPVSSSGHLVIVSKFLDFQEQGVAFDICVHLGTLVSVVIVFREELVHMVKVPLAAFKGRITEEQHNFLVWDIYIVVATLPAVVAGLFLKPYIEQIFSNIMLVYSMLAVTGCIMVISKFIVNRGTVLKCPHALLIGCAQAMAIFPGLSRSGATIFTGMVLGIDRETVAKFSFIMSIPAILGAVVLQTGDFISNPPEVNAIIGMAVGMIASALSGYFAIILLLNVIRKNKLEWFGYYCLILSAVGFMTLA